MMTYREAALQQNGFIFITRAKILAIDSSKSYQKCEKCHKKIHPVNDYTCNCKNTADAKHSMFLELLLEQSDGCFKGKLFHEYGKKNLKLDEAKVQHLLKNGKHQGMHLSYFVV